MLKQVFQFSHIVLFSLVLLACGNAGTGGGESNDSGDSGSIVGDGNGDGDAPAETIGVRIETNTESGLVERNNINPLNISIVALDHEFEEGHSIEPPFAVTKEADGDGDGYQLEFNELFVEQPNFVIKAVVGKDSNGKNIELYSTIYTLTSGSIPVNIFSHYVLKKFFDTLETAEDLNTLLPCEASTCANQSLAKAKLLAEISKAAQEYEITVPSNLSILESVSFLDNQVDFRTHIETAVAEISRDISPIAKGTRRSFSATDPTILQPHNTEYNALWFALSFNNLNPENDQNEVVIASETSEIIENDPDIIYPSYNQLSTLLDVRKEILSSDIPFTRASLAISQNIGQNNNYSHETSSPFNFIATLLQNDSFASTEGFLLNARVLSQQVPTDNGVENIGWQFNPFFSKLYHANEYELDTEQITDESPDLGVSPTWLLGANYSTGGSFNVTKNSSNKFDRGTQREDLNIFSWEVHGQETDTDFNIDQINGNTYGVINYSLNLEDGSSVDSDNVLELFAETEQWEVNNGEVIISQPSIQTTHFQSYIRSREKNNTVDAQNDLISSSIGTRDISLLTTKDNLVFENRGLITLDGSLSSKGHSTQDGKHLAFVYERGLDRDGQDRGRGITIATELSTNQPIFPVLNDDKDNGIRYTLLGNTFGINADANTLRNVNNSILTLSDRIAGDGTNNSSCNATLEGASTFIKHIVGTGIDQNTLSTPLTESTVAIPSETCILDDNRIEIKFDAIGDAAADTMFNQNLTLKGFISPQDEVEGNTTIPGNVISLLWVQDDNLGLVFATKDQQLSPTFD